MFRNVLFALLLLTLTATLALTQDDLTATTRQGLNVRPAPSINNQPLGTLPGQTTVIVEGRNATSSWLLIRTPDNSVRGWVSRSLLRFSRPVSFGTLPVITLDIESGVTSTEPAVAATEPAIESTEPATSTASPAGGVVHAYLQARVNLDAATMVGLACPAFQAQAQIQAESFDAMNAELNGVACVVTDQTGNQATVACSGTIRTHYDGATRDWAIPAYNAELVGEYWQVCGEAG
jgi:hypothetical protein